MGQLARRAAWPDHQLTAAIGAHAAQLLVRAAAAKRAFKGADARFGGLVGQVGVAALAAGAELEDGGALGGGTGQNLR